MPEQWEYVNKHHPKSKTTNALPREGSSPIALETAGAVFGAPPRTLSLSEKEVSMHPPLPAPQFPFVGPEAKWGEP